MKASAAMTRNVVCVEPSDSLQDAYEIMTEWEIRHLPVLEGQSLVGILSDRDILIHASPSSDGMLEVEPLTVGEVMTSDPITCRSTTSVTIISETMIKHKIDSVPVVDDDHQLVGLVTSSDLIELLIAKEGFPVTKPLPVKYSILASARPGISTQYKTGTGKERLGY